MQSGSNSDLQKNMVLLLRVPNKSFSTLKYLYTHFRRFVSHSPPTFKGIKDEAMSEIRNIGIMAHIDAGKTTTSERMLFYSGFSNHLGDVDHGDTVMDYMEQEKARGITITSAAITFHWNKHKINLIDTPGHVDFTVEVERCLRVLDGAVTILDASKGVEAQTLTVWSQAERYNLPSIVYLNKMDRPTANIQSCLQSISDKLKIEPLLINFPIRSDNKVKGIVDIVSLKKIMYNFDRSCKGQFFSVEKLDSQNNAELYNMALGLRNDLIGSLADYDENIAESILSDNMDISADKINSVLRKATIQRKIVPVLCGSALKNAGVQPLLDAITYYLPSPLDKSYELVQFYETDLCAFAFKVIHDKHRGPLTFFRLYSGIMNTKSSLYNINKDYTEKGGRLIHVFSDEYKEVTSASAGNIVCVSGLQKTQTSDTVTNNSSTAKTAASKMHHYRKQKGLVDDQFELPVLGGITVLSPVVYRSIEAPSLSVYKDFEIALACLQREDPSLTVKNDEDSGQTIIGGMGELHLEIVKQRLLSEYKLNVHVGKPEVAYKETIEDDVEWEETLDRSLGDKKHHVVLKLSLHFNKNMKQFKHVTIVKTKEERFEHLWKQHLKAIDDGVKMALSHGPLKSYPVVDVEVHLHKVEINRGTSDAMIQACASMCVSKALKQSNSVLLEPMMKMEITTDEDNLSAVMRDLSGRRSHLLDTDSKDNIRIVHAYIPLAESLGYSNDLREITYGMGNFTMEFSHYEKMSSMDQQKKEEEETGF